MGARCLFVIIARRSAFVGFTTEFTEIMENKD